MLTFNEINDEILLATSSEPPPPPQSSRADFFWFPDSLENCRLLEILFVMQIKDAPITLPISNVAALHRATAVLGM